MNELFLWLFVVGLYVCVCVCVVCVCDLTFGEYDAPRHQHQHKKINKSENRKLLSNNMTRPSSMVFLCSRIIRFIHILRRLEFHWSNRASGWLYLSMDIGQHRKIGEQAPSTSSTYYTVHAPTTLLRITATHRNPTKFRIPQTFHDAPHASCTM